jgi:hypothetical protein
MILCRGQGPTKGRGITRIKASAMLAQSRAGPSIVATLLTHRCIWRLLLSPAPLAGGVGGEHPHGPSGVPTGCGTRVGGPTVGSAAGALASTSTVA